MATPGITKVIQAYDTLKTKVANTKLKEHVKQERGYAAGSAVLGAILAGAADAKYRDPDGSSKKLGPIPAVVGISAGVALLGITDLIPYGVYMGMAGVGGVCYYVGKSAFDHVSSNAGQAPPAQGA